MPKDKLIAMPNVVTPNNPVLFTEKCNGCNHCVEVCQVDVYIYTPRKASRRLSCIPKNAGTAAVVLMIVPVRGR